MNQTSKSSSTVKKLDRVEFANISSVKIHPALLKPYHKIYTTILDKGYMTPNEIFRSFDGEEIKVLFEYCRQFMMEDKEPSIELQSFVTLFQTGQSITSRTDEEQLVDTEKVCVYVGLELLYLVQLEKHYIDGDLNGCSSLIEIQQSKRNTYEL